MKENRTTPTASAHAQAAAEAVRLLNHATLPGSRWPTEAGASGVSGVLGSLSNLAGRLPQTIRQLSHWIEHHPEGLSLDGGADEYGLTSVDEALATVMDVLVEAEQESARLQESLAVAARIMSHVAGPSTTPPTAPGEDPSTG